MYLFEGEETIRQWKDAREALYKLYEFFAECYDNPALLQTLDEADKHAKGMLRRARERVGGE